eukprot:9191159-Karenia_brevis.AAC.1
MMMGPGPGLDRGPIKWPKSAPAIASLIVLKTRRKRTMAHSSKIRTPMPQLKQSMMVTMMTMMMSLM